MSEMKDAPNPPYVLPLFLVRLPLKNSQCLAKIWLVPIILNQNEVFLEN